MALTQVEIQQNKNAFLKLVSEIDIPGADTQGLVEYLITTGFFEAPASTQHHCNYTGGLCEHSLNVYYTLEQLYNTYKDNLTVKYDKSTLLTVGLFHDISKTDLYEKYVKNEKVYSPQGSKHDNMGKFEWVAVEAFKVRDAKNRFLAGNHEENSMLILGRYIPLMHEEMVAILNHHGGIGKESNWDLSAITNAHPLLALLHTADYLSTFLLERDSNV